MNASVPGVSDQPGREPGVDEQLAAAVVAALFAARSGAAAEPETPETSRWNDRAAGLRKALHPGADAWRFSLR